MPPQQQDGYIWSLIDKILLRGPAPKVHFASEVSPHLGNVSHLYAHRFSLCLSASAKYVIMRQGRRTEIEVKRGEVIYALPNCLMESHPQGHYLSFGLVFQTGLTRFLLARKQPQLGQTFTHRFLLTHHCYTAMDAEGRAFLGAMARCAKEPEDIRYVQRLIELLLLKSQSLLQRNQPSTEGKAKLTWLAACQFIQDHIQEPLGRKDVAEFLHIHPNHVSRLFSQFSEQSFHQYLQQSRMERARELMSNQALNITEVANACGFTDSSYFSRCYRNFLRE